MHPVGKWVPLTVLLCVTALFAEDWPQYLGPTRDGNSAEKGILRIWPDDGPQVLWSVTVGKGFGGPVVKEGKVYLLDRDDQVGDNLRCLDLAGGEELWSFAYDSPGSVMFPGSRSVPTLDGNRVYSCGPYGDLYCIDTETHEPVWNKNVWKDFGGQEIPRWAITQNPLVYGDLLILASQAPEAGVVAYEKLTGTVRWKTPPLGRLGYVSPSLFRVSGLDQVVMITASEGGRGEAGSGGKVVGMDPKIGEILWEYSGWQCRLPVPSALDAGEGRLLVTGGYDAGAAMIRVVKNGNEGYTVEELYKTLEFGTHTKPPVLYDGFFYGQYSTNERKDGLVCMSLDGQIMWKTKTSPVFDKGSSILVDGLLLSTDGRRSLYLIEPNPTAFKPLASVQLLEGNQNWAPIALADGRLLIRDQGQLKCLQVAP